LVHIAVTFRGGKVRNYRVATPAEAKIENGLLSMRVSDTRVINIPVMNVDIVDTNVLTEEEAEQRATPVKQRAATVPRSQRPRGVSGHQ
jgi:hypothetical protein